MLWDQKVGDQAGDMDVYIKHLVTTLLSNMKAKSLRYNSDTGFTELLQARSYLFCINNTFYLLEQFSSQYYKNQKKDAEQYRLDKPWFKEKVGKLFESQKELYLSSWEAINKNLTAVNKSELIYQSDRLLTLESGRLLKTRFQGFIDDFERTYNVHKQLTILDVKLREMLQKDVKAAFLHRYKRFFEKYSRLQFSKKKMDEYLKYPPQKVDAMIGELYASQ